MTYSRCDPGDHDDTGARTDQHAMDLVSAEWILRKARDNGWPGSPFPNKARHHLCGNLLARDYVNQCFSDPGAGGPPSGSGSSLCREPDPPHPHDSDQSKRGSLEMGACPVCTGDHGDGMICTPWRDDTSSDGNAGDNED